MNDIHYFIADKIFAKFPGYARGVVLAYGVRNGDSPPELVALLREAEASLRTRLSIDQVNAEPRFASWREAFRWSGAKPSDFRASVEAMARRLLRNQEVPSTNALVDIGNTISLRHLMPAGGHAIDVVKGDFALPPVPRSEVEEACREMIELITRFCGGRTRYEVLSRENPRIRLSE